MGPDPRIRDLLERALESDATPEEVCRDAPELLGHVREELARLAPLRDELERLFPAGDAPPPAAPSRAPADGVPGYTLELVLGRGGMGIVYRARHARLGQVVALKMLLSGASARPAELARFRREAQVVASLRHPNVVQVHDVGEVDGCAWFTMEYVGGGTLAERMRQRVSAREAAALVATLARAVQCAHDSGIVHRDLKPSNVLLTEDGMPKISDFGLARRIDAGTALTLGGALGTPSYMAPEQLGGPARQVGPAADVHALGAILYELLAGQPPFRGATPAATLRQVMQDDPVPPSRRSSRVPRDLETVALKCLRKDPALRYASASELADDLQRFLRHEPVRARRAGPFVRVLRWSQRRPAAALLVGLALVGVGYLVAVGVRGAVLAAEQRAASRPWAAHLERAEAALTTADLSTASALLDQVPEALSPELRARHARARADLTLVRRLDAVRMGRAAVVDSRYDPARNRALADEAYAAAFDAVGLRPVADGVATTAERIRASAVSSAVVAALDDWALCAGEPALRARLLELARTCDPDPDGWRDRARDPALHGDAPGLLALAEQAPLESASAQLLLALAEEIDRAGGDARPFLRAVQRRHSGDFWVNFVLGDLLWMREPEEAARYMQAAVAIRPDSAVAHLGLGRVMITLERYPEALECFGTAIRIDPDYSHAHANLGNALIQVGRSEEAWEEFEVALRLDPRAARNHYSMGALLVDDRRYEEALPYLFEAVRLEPDARNNRCSLGIALRSLGREEEALVHLRRSVEIDPADAFSWHHLATSLHRAKRYEEALAAYSEAKRLRPASATSSYYIANCLFSLGRIRESLSHYEEALRLRPDDGDFHGWYGHALLRNARFADAARHLARAVETGVIDVGTLRALVLAQLLSGKGAEALATWRALVEREADDAIARDGQAELCLYVGDEVAYAEAIDELLDLHAASQDPHWCEVAGRAALLVPPTPERLERASALIERALAADPSASPEWAPPYYQFAKALAEYRAGALDAAVARLRGRCAGVLRPAPQLVLALALHDRGERAEARATLAEALMDFDWSGDRVTSREDWMLHILRREAVARVLPELASEDGPGSDDAERAARIADELAQQRYAAAADLVRAWLDAEPEVFARYPKVRWAAGWASCFAGIGLGSDAERTTGEQRRAWRALALRTLEEDIAELARQVDLDDVAEREAGRRRLRNWLSDRRVDLERGGLDLAALPHAERPAWDELLAEARALGARIDADGG